MKEITSIWSTAQTAGMHLQCNTLSHKPKQNHELSNPTVCLINITPEFVVYLLLTISGQSRPCLPMKTPHHLPKLRARFAGPFFFGKSAGRSLRLPLRFQLLLSTTPPAQGLHFISATKASNTRRINRQHCKSGRHHPEPKHRQPPERTTGNKCASQCRSSSFCAGNPNLVLANPDMRHRPAFR